MKYLKTYEDISYVNKEKPYGGSKYKIGDYILLDRKHYPTLKSLAGKIKGVGQDNDLYYWVVNLSDGTEMWCAEWMTIRKLTPEEIEQFDLEYQGKKYNL